MASTQSPKCVLKMAICSGPYSPGSLWDIALLSLKTYQLVLFAALRFCLEGLKFLVIFIPIYLASATYMVSPILFSSALSLRGLHLAVGQVHWKFPLTCPGSDRLDLSSRSKPATLTSSEKHGVAAHAF